MPLQVLRVPVKCGAVIVPRGSQTSCHSQGREGRPVCEWRVPQRSEAAGVPGRRGWRGLRLKKSPSEGPGGEAEAGPAAQWLGRDRCPPLALGRATCLPGRQPVQGPVSTLSVLVPQSNRMDYVEINIDHKFHRHLIGKSGANSECGRRTGGGLLTGVLTFSLGQVVRSHSA